MIHKNMTKGYDNMADKAKGAMDKKMYASGKKETSGHTYKKLKPSKKKNKMSVADRIKDKLTSRGATHESKKGNRYSRAESRKAKGNPRAEKAKEKANPKGLLRGKY